MRAVEGVQLAADLNAFDMLDCQDVPAFTEWAMTLHPARLGNAYSLAGLAMTARLVDVPWCRKGDEVPHLAAVMSPTCQEWAAFNRRQGCLPGIASPLPMSRKADASLMVAQPAQLAQANAGQAPLLPPVGADDAAYARPMAAAGLISYRLRGRYGFIAIGALSAEEAMRQAARSTDKPAREALEVWCDKAGAFVAANQDHSEGGPVTADAFWRVYAAIAAGLYAAGTLTPWFSGLKGSPAKGDHRASGVCLSQMARRSIEDLGAPHNFDTQGPVMKATLKAVGCKARARRDILAFVRGLA